MRRKQPKGKRIRANADQLLPIKGHELGPYILPASFPVISIFLSNESCFILYNIPHPSLVLPLRIRKATFKVTDAEESSPVRPSSFGEPAIKHEKEGRALQRRSGDELGSRRAKPAGTNVKTSPLRAGSPEAKPQQPRLILRLQRRPGSSKFEVKQEPVTSTPLQPRSAVPTARDAGKFGELRGGRPRRQPGLAREWEEVSLSRYGGRGPASSDGPAGGGVRARRELRKPVHGRPPLPREAGGVPSGGASRTRRELPKPARGRLGRLQEGAGAAAGSAGPPRREPPKPGGLRASNPGAADGRPKRVTVRRRWGDEAEVAGASIPANHEGLRTRGRGVGHNPRGPLPSRASIRGAGPVSSVMPSRLGGATSLRLRVQRTGFLKVERGVPQRGTLRRGVPTGGIRGVRLGVRALGKGPVGVGLRRGVKSGEGSASVVLAKGAKRVKRATVKAIEAAMVDEGEERTSQSAATGVRVSARCA